MRIEITHDFWGNCWLVKLDGHIVADNEQEYQARANAQRLQFALTNAGVTVTQD